MGSAHLILTDVMVRGTLVEPLEGRDGMAASVREYGRHGITAHVWHDGFVDAVEAWLHSLGLRGQRASSGFLMVGAALATCSQVTLYGFFPFGCDAEGRSVPYHYYEAGNHDTSLHDMSDEFMILRQLRDAGAIRLVDDDLAPGMQRNISAGKVRHGYLRHCRAAGRGYEQSVD